MKRLIVMTAFCAAATAPAAAQTFNEPPRRSAMFEAAFKAVTGLQQPAPAPAPPPRGYTKTTKEKTAYIVSLAAAAAGTAYTVTTTHEALDHLEARTFPVLWWTASEPKDKNKMTGIIVGANGALMALGAR